MRHLPVEQLLQRSRVRCAAGQVFAYPLRGVGRREHLGHTSHPGHRRPDMEVDVTEAPLICGIGSKFSPIHHPEERYRLTDRPEVSWRLTTLKRGTP
jgi:hypothetical protein